MALSSTVVSLRYYTATAFQETPLASVCPLSL